MVAHEDAMAIREFDALLKSHGIESKLLGIQLPEELEGDWFPKGAAEEISNWRGHVIFVCTKSLPPAFSDQLRECGFPYEFHRIGSSTPFLRNLVDRHDWHSPTDWDPPHNRDFSVVAKLRRDGIGQMAYIVAGIRAIGTWGAASFLTNGKNVRQLGVESNQQFAAVVETSFDQQTFQIIDSKLKTTPILI